MLAGFKRPMTVRTAMYVADDVERAMLMAAVVPQRHSFNDDGFDVIDRFQHENMPKAFPLEAS